MNTLDLQQAAAFLHIHEHTLERMARNGIIPGAKPGKRWVFLEEDLAEWLRGQDRYVRAAPKRPKMVASRYNSPTAALAAGHPPE